MWTGEILSIAPNGDGLTVTLTYRVTDGTTVIDKTENLVSPDRNGDLAGQIKSIVLDNVNFRNRVDNQKAVIAAFDPTPFIGPVVVPSPPDLTQDQIDQQTYQQAVQQLIRAKGEADAIVFGQASADPTIQDLATTAATIAAKKIATKG